MRQASIKTENKLMDLSNYSCKYCPYTGRITGSYIIYDKGGPIDIEKHVPLPVAQ